MTLDSNAHSNVEEDEDEEFWNRWRLNTYERKLVKPMKKPLTAPLDLAVSDSDVEKLKAGFRPRNLDDKYAWLIEDENGNISIHVIRYFVKEEVYILHIAPKLSNDNSASAKIHSITWEGDMIGIRDGVEQAKKNVVMLARVILKCDFENAPGTV
jgi:microsomal dipeptidase-like Zn-dependent dipeptidase